MIGCCDSLWWSEVVDQGGCGRDHGFDGPRQIERGSGADDDDDDGTVVVSFEQERTLYICIVFGWN
jgi:hypothetical protein